MSKWQNTAANHHHQEGKSGHGGHHGGAWKVAYADFVTAMMALFIVLWLLNSSEQVRKAISAYFRDPSGSGKLSGSAQPEPAKSLSVNKDNMSTTEGEARSGDQERVRSSRS